MSSLLSHVPICPSLKDGHYWCTQCSRPEKFTQKSVSPGTGKMSTATGRKDSRLKRASTFFKNLSHGHSGQRAKSTPVSHSSFDGSGSKIARSLSAFLDRKKRRNSTQDQTISMDKEVVDPDISIMRDDTFTPDLDKLENLEAEDLQQLLDGFGEGEESVHQPNALRRTDTIPAEAYLRAETSFSGLEFAVSCPPTGPLPPIPTQGVTASSANEFACAELDGTDQMLVLPSNGFLDSRSVSPFPDVNSSRPITPSPVSPLGVIIEGSHLAEDMDMEIDDQRASKSFQLSDTPLVVSTGSSHVSTAAPQTIQSVYPRQVTDDLNMSTTSMEPQDTVPNIMLYSTPSHISIPATDRCSEFLENSSFQSTEARVKEVRALIDVINREWIERMTNSPRLLSRCAGLSTSLLFEKGISAIQSSFRGNFPSTFFELFGLAHVALAIVYTFHRDDDWCRWEEMFNDLLRWQRVLHQETERAFYLEAMTLLQQPKTPPEGWIKQINPAQRSGYSDPLHVTPASHIRTDRPLSQLTSKSAKLTFGSQNDDHLTDDLRTGRVMLDCEIFLDGKSVLFEALQSRNHFADDLQTWNIPALPREIMPCYLDISHGIQSRRMPIFHICWITSWHLCSSLKASRLYKTLL